VTMLPVALKRPLAEHLVRVQAQHARDLAAGRGAVALPVRCARSTFRRRGSGRGSGYFRRRVSIAMRRPASAAVTIRTSRSFSGRSRTP
jgi:hypothetical protein